MTQNFELAKSAATAEQALFTRIAAIIDLEDSARGHVSAVNRVELQSKTVVKGGIGDCWIERAAQGYEGPVGQAVTQTASLCSSWWSKWDRSDKDHYGLRRRIDLTPHGATDKTTIHAGPYELVTAVGRVAHLYQRGPERTAREQAAISGLMPLKWSYTDPSWISQTFEAPTPNERQLSEWVAQLENGPDSLVLSPFGQLQSEEGLLVRSALCEGLDGLRDCLARRRSPDFLFYMGQIEAMRANVDNLYALSEGV